MNFSNGNVPNAIELYALKRLKWSVLCCLYFIIIKTAINNTLRKIREIGGSVIITFLGIIIT